LIRHGIGALSSADVRAGAERGWRLKLLAVARRVGEHVEAGVTPAYVPHAHPFARPRGAENVVLVRGRGCGVLTFAGTGAGGDATASAVVADVVAALDGRVGHLPAHAGEDLIARPLRLPVLVRYDDGSVLTPEAIPLDELAATARVYGARGNVRSVIPVWSEAD
jgi:hypothetical protein